MKTFLNIKQQAVAIEIICYLHIFLFCYAAISKILDFENFQVQVAQSPMLTAYTGPITVMIPIIEILLALLLALPKFRNSALLASYGLMIMFSTYIFIILNYSPYVPCSCGGILEKMDWNQHLIFNLVVASFALVGAYLSLGKLPDTRLNKKQGILILTAVTMGAIVIMFLLFYTSENTIHHRNNFVRRTPPFITKKAHQMDLKYNSFYFAGYEQNKIYLSNTTAPSIITILDTALTKKEEIKIKLQNEVANLTQPQIKILPPNVFVLDGLSSTIYRGDVTNWKAKLMLTNLQRFTVAEPIDSATIAFRAATVAYGNVLGTFNWENKIEAKLHKALLEKQIDGYFDTDGSMHYSEEMKRFVYVYYYRNEFIVTDKNLNLVSRGHTIDTTTKARVTIKYINSKKQNSLAAPPFMVNRKSALHKNLLFINSLLPGRYDPKIMWDKSSVIDVYDITNNSYRMSFYIEKIDGRAFDSFIVTDEYLFALYDKTVIAYHFSPFLTKEFKKL